MFDMFGLLKRKKGSSTKSCEELADVEVFMGISYVRSKYAYIHIVEVPRKSVGSIDRKERWKPYHSGGKVTGRDARSL